LQITLTTTGRKTGEPHKVTLYAYPDGEGLVVVGSYGGSAGDPDWAANLRAHPTATVRRNRDILDYTAREVEGAERERLWEMVTKAFPLYESYQRRTDRLIPLFVLEPAVSPWSGDAETPAKWSHSA
jgi:deazaflavin-dependent oxidoreductase (nitroreductase family)